MLWYIDRDTPAVMRLLVAIVVALTSTLDSSAQELVLRGRVADAGSAVPIAHARVTAILAPQRIDGARNPSVDTDDRGEFALTLPPNTTSIRITKATYALVTLAAPTSSQRVDVRLTPGGVIVGRLLDGNGMPSTGLYVRAFPVGNDGTIPSDSIFFAFADDRGEFRIGGLPEGRYVLKASAEGSEPSAPVALRAGEQLEVPMSRIPAAQCRFATGATAPVNRQRRSIVRGRVVNASGIPMACTAVQLGPVSSQLPDPAEFLSRSELHTFTDSDGRFEFNDVPEGVYAVYASMKGYARAREGPIEVTPPRTDDARPTAVAADVTIRLAPAGVIAGTVYDEDGEPMEATTVLARQLRLVDGHPVGTGLTSVRTDDQGRFRLFGLDAGRWLVSSTGNDSPLSTTSSFYYPGTPDSRLAIPVDIAAGETRDGINIAWTRVAGVTIAGTVIDSNGLPLADGNATLDVSHRSGAMKTLPLPIPVANGRFEFALVPPGDYVVQVGRNTGRAWEFGRAFVTVADAAPSPLSVRLTEGRSVRGTVRLDDGSSPAALIRIRLMPVDPDDAPSGRLIAESVPTSDDEFRAEHVVGANRFVLVNAPAGWYLKSIRIGGTETVEQPFDFGFGGDPIRDVQIVVSPAGASVSGAVGDREAVRGGYTTVVFSTNPEDWYSQSPRVRFARSTSDGRYKVTGIPPGTYYVAALPVMDDVTMWQDQVLLNGLIGDAVRVTLNESETRDVSLKPPSR